MMFGTSYSLIVHEAIVGKEYVFNISGNNITFVDNLEIAINTRAKDDNIETIDSNEYYFTVFNNNDFDINYRLDILESDLINLGKNIHYTYNLNNDEYVSYKDLEKDITIKQNKVLKRKQKDIYKLRIWLSSDVDKKYLDRKVSAVITLSATKKDSKYATNVVEEIENSNPNSVTFIDNSYRYIGSDNYVWFNCRDNYTSGDDYCEKWRIIGSFDNKVENSDKVYKSLKITSNKVFSVVPFNNDDSTNKYDNSYINSYANGYYYDLLNNSAKDLIQKSQFFFGDTPNLNYDNAMYSERGNNIYTNVGLLNISDYLYLGFDKWLINSPNIMTISKNNDLVNVVNKNIIKMPDKIAYSFVPVVYLRSDVSFNSGDGSFDSPYELVIKYPLNLGSSK